MNAERCVNRMWWCLIVWPVRIVGWAARCACWILHALSGYTVYLADSIELWADRTFIEITRNHDDEA